MLSRTKQKGRSALCCLTSWISFCSQLLFALVKSSAHTTGSRVSSSGLRMRPKYLTSPGYTTIHISPWTLNVPKIESIQVPHARPCLKTTGPTRGTTVDAEDQPGPTRTIPKAEDRRGPTRNTTVDLRYFGQAEDQPGPTRTIPQAEDQPGPTKVFPAG